MDDHDGNGCLNNGADLFGACWPLEDGLGFRVRRQLRRRNSPAELEPILPAGLLRAEACLELRRCPRVILHRRAYYRLWLPESNGYPHKTILNRVQPHAGFVFQERSRLEPMKKVARMLRAHEELLLNWFRAKGEISGGAFGGLNNKIRVITRRPYGFRTYEAMEIALYHTLGRLPEPESTHRYC